MAWEGDGRRGAGDSDVRAWLLGNDGGDVNGPGGPVRRRWAGEEEKEKKRREECGPIPVFFSVCIFPFSFSRK